MMEKDYVGLSEASSSAFNGDTKAAAAAAAAAAAESVDERETGSEEEELELGLSLGVKNKVTSGKNKVGAWGDHYCRILTAKDFPTPLRSRASPLSSSSSVSSSPTATNRVSDPGSANPPCQVVVGWPPIRAFRMNSLINPPKDNNISDSDAITDKNQNKKKKKKKNNNSDQSIDSKKHGSNALRFVKVKMDGDPIGRKVDLSAHHSYETLAMALEIMFHKPTIQLCSSAHRMKASKLLDGSAEFALTYEDKDGDWMLVGDVPWGMFLDTVKRLRIMRTSDANGLAPRFQSSTGGLLRGKLT